MKANIKLTLGRLTPKGINMLLGVVAKAMTDNPHFAAPLVSPVEMLALQAEISSAMAIASNGSRGDKFKRNDLVEQAKALLNKQADYVRGIAGGDKLILASSGFELQRDREPLGVPGPPLHLASKSVAHNTLDIRWNRVHGAIAYMVQRCDVGRTGDPHAWETIGVTMKARITLTGLERLKESSYRVSSLGTAGQGLYSASITAYAV